MKLLQTILITLILGIGGVTGSYAVEEEEINKFKLLSSDAALEELFGSAVAISGNTAIVGARGDRNAGENSGSAQVFVRSGDKWIRQAELIARDTGREDEFGFAVSISGNFAIVGAPKSDGREEDSGSAYIFVRNGPNWTQDAKLTSVDAERGDWFGHSVGISRDFAVVGAPRKRDRRVGSFVGSAYVFRRIGDSWIMLAKLTASDGGRGDWFGCSVAISADTAIIGACRDIVNGVSSGSAYIFERSGLRWDEQAKLTARDATKKDEFGFAVSISGNFAVIGAPNKQSAYIFERRGPDWVQRGIRVGFLKLIPDNKPIQDNAFGSSVSIWENIVIVGAPKDNSTGQLSGAAYIFTRSGDLWPQEAKLTASDATALDEFGFAAAIGEDTVIVGSAKNDGVGIDSGGAYIFERSQTIWTEDAKFTASGGAVGDQFGFAVSISGDTAIVGARQDDDAGSNSGSVYILVRRGIGKESFFLQQAKLTASDATAGDQFGASVAISRETAIIGAPGRNEVDMDSGCAYIFARIGSIWAEQAKLVPRDAAAHDLFGGSVAISGNIAIVGAPKNNNAGFFSGSAYVFARSGSIWTEEAKLIPNDTAIGDLFGTAVAVTGETVLVGAPENDVVGTDSGSAYIFIPGENGWMQEVKLIAGDASVGDLFGASVAINRGSVIVGAPENDDAGGIDSGSAYIFTRRDGNWTQQVKLIADDGGPGDRFGSSVIVSGDTAVVGASQDDEEDGGPDSGSAYIFQRRGFSWKEREKLIASDAKDGNLAFAQFGVSTAVSGSFVIIGATGDNDGGADSGAVYIYHFFDDTLLSVDQSLLEAMRFGDLKRTMLLQNYPNPFNPETWLPYQLTTAAPAIIRIYNLRGQLVRQLDLGAKPAGSYISKDKAAYWDGEDQFGEGVSTGIYFYTLRAGTFEATRRMIILK